MSEKSVYQWRRAWALGGREALRSQGPRATRRPGVDRLKGAHADRAEVPPLLQRCRGDPTGRWGTSRTSRVPPTPARTRPTPAPVLPSPAPPSVSVSVSFSAVRGRSDGAEARSRSGIQPTMNAGERPRAHPTPPPSQLESMRPLLSRAPPPRVQSSVRPALYGPLHG
ncbi:hypothetical protein [Streptomyces sp. NBC_01373]|uniref:hypothetical protein n=1 Tax=Streptomyces sp. NBC_01373 TaxID=2903843 RepID=UPI002B1E3BD2|nr:hypothetical protein [Streptomyces sp. NBC_01373]